MRNFDKNIIITASLLAAFTIAIGAFGAHALKSMVSDNQVAVFGTGVRYQMYHSLALLFLGMVGFVSEKIKKQVFWLFIFGIGLFSGSIYLLSLNGTMPFFDFRKIGFLTPIGGLLFICGWLRIALAFYSLKKP